MNKKYRLTYTLHTELGERTCVETFRYFETVLQVLRNLNEHCKIDNVKIEGIQMNFYKLLDIETGEDLYVNPKHIVFYMRTDDGVLIDNGSVRILTLKADFENMMILEGAKEW